MAPTEGSREVCLEEVEATSLDDQFLFFFLGAMVRVESPAAEDENDDR